MTLQSRTSVPQQTTGQAAAASVAEVPKAPEVPQEAGQVELLRWSQNDIALVLVSL